MSSARPSLLAVAFVAVLTIRPWHPPRDHSFFTTEGNQREMRAELDREPETPDGITRYWKSRGYPAAYDEENVRIAREAERLLEEPMIRTFGLTHINLQVRSPERSLRFYEAVFGVREYYRDSASIQALGPGPKDVIAFERSSRAAGRKGGISHFGFRLRNPKDIDRAVAEVEGAGGKLLRRGEFGPGSPFAYVQDPDGYEIEIWYE